MIARFSITEIAALLGVELPFGSERVSCIGVGVSLETLQSGALYLHLPGGGFAPEEAFQRGAALLVVPSGYPIAAEMRPYTLEVGDTIESFWRLFRRWRSGVTAPVIVSIGSSPSVIWTEEFLALLFLTRRKGCFRSSPSGRRKRESCPLELYELAAQLMSGHEENFWYLVGIPEGDNRFLTELKPDFFLSGEAPIAETADDLLYLGGGEFFYTDEDFTLPSWPSPLIESARAFRRAGALGSEIEEKFRGAPGWNDDELQNIAKRIFFPPYLGFRIPLGEAGSLWVERIGEPSVQRVSEVRSGLPDEYTLALVTEGEEEALRELAEPHSDPHLALSYHVLRTEDTSSTGETPPLHGLIQALASRQPYFLLAFLSSDNEAERIFLSSHEMYSLANRESEEDNT